MEVEASNRVIRTVSLVCIVEGELLLARTHGRSAFYVPGGKVEPGEASVAALAREVREELGVAIDRRSLRYLGRMVAPAHGERAHVLVEMQCFLGAICGEPIPSSEISEVRFVSPADYRSHPDTAPAVLRLLDRLHLLGHI